MPCLVRTRMHYIIFLAEIGFIVIQLIRRKTIKLNKTISKIFFSFFPFYLYYTCLILAKIIETSDSTYLIEYTNSLYVAIYVIALGVAMTAYHEIYKIDVDNFYSLLVIVATLQLCFVVLSFFVPSIKDFFNNLTRQNSYNENIVAVIDKGYMMTWRAFGLAENLFDGFGFVISILISVTFALGLNGGNKYLIGLSILMWIMPLLNARTGLFLCIVNFLIIISRYLSAKTFLASLGLVAGIGFYFISELFQALPDGLQVALISGLDDFSNLSKGETSGVFSEIFDADLVFPGNIIFGQGCSPERLGKHEGIDSGYIQCIWRFGVVGSLLLFGAYMHSFYYAYKLSERRIDVAILLSILLSMVAYGFKLFYIMGFANVFLVFSVLFMLILSKKKQMPFSKVKPLRRTIAESNENI